MVPGRQMHQFWQMLADKISMLVPRLSVEQLNAAVHQALDQGDMVTAPSASICAPELLSC